MAKEIGRCRYVARRLAWHLLSRFASQPIPFTLPGGQRILLPPRSPFAADIYCTRGFVDWGSEQLVLDYLAQRPERGICYDVGANMGYYSLLLASASKHVFAFEPDPRNFDNLRLQAIENFSLIQKAVSSSCDPALLDVSSASTVSHLVSQTPSSKVIEIECITLDAFRKSRPDSETVAVVKMDVEGFEIACLQGSSQLATEDRPVFLIEYGMEEGRPNSFEALGDFVEAHGYAIFAMIRQSQSWLKFSTNLELTQASQLPQQDHKMLFLVPQEDAFFKKRCATVLNLNTWHIN